MKSTLKLKYDAGITLSPKDEALFRHRDYLALKTNKKDFAYFKSKQTGPKPLRPLITRGGAGRRG